MRKRLLVLFFALSIVLLSLPAGSAPAGVGLVVYVDDNWTGTGPGTDPDGLGPATSFGYDAFADIQSGVNAAAAGGTVYVAAGTYFENVTLTANGIHLMGATGAIIDGGGVGDCVLVHADNVTVDGFELRNGYSGILADLGPTGSTFSHNSVHNNVNTPGNVGTGIMLWGDCDNNTIHGNDIYANDRQGIFIGYGFTTDPAWLSTGNTVDGNIVHGNGQYTMGGAPDRSNYGIQLWYVQGSLVTGNEIYGQSQPGLTGFADVGIGLYLSQAPGNTVTYNNIHDNRIGVAMYDCGVSNGCAGNSILSNGITGFDIAGFRLYNDAETTAFHANELSGVAFGAKNADTQVLDATGNWWGSASGPAHSSNTYNIDSQGVAVTDNVAFVPWLDAPPPGGVLFSPVTTTSPAGSYSSIQAAVDASTSGATVWASPGVFREQVLITKNLSLLGSGAGTTTIESPDTADLTTMAGTRTTRAVVGVTSPDPSVATVTAHIEGFTIDGRGQAPESSDSYYGVHFYSANGSLDDSVVTRIRCATLSGVQNVAAVCANHPYDISVPMTVDVTDNLITDYQKGGIILNEWGTSGTVSGNVVVGQGPTGVTAQNGIQVGYGATALVSGNTVSAHHYTGPDWDATGILIVGNTIGGPIPGTEVLGNSVTDNDVGISFATDAYYGYGDALGVANGNSVSGNDIGLDNKGAGLLDATGNWWGSPSGANHQGDSPTGTGDLVTGNVNHDPWYVDEALTTLSDAIPLTTRVFGHGSIGVDPDQETYTYGSSVELTAVEADGWHFSHWEGSVTGSTNPTTLAIGGLELVTAVFFAAPPPPPPSGSTGPFDGESDDGVVEINVPVGICPNPVILTIGSADDPPPSGGNPTLGAYDVELTDATTGGPVHELTGSVTITFHYTAAMLAAAGVADPHDLRIWYWDTDAEPPCWVALPTIVDEAAMTISTTVDHLTTFTAMVDADFPALADAAGHWAEADILRLASLGVVNGYEDGTFRPEAPVTRAQFAKFIVLSLGLAPGTALSDGFTDAADVQTWAVPYVSACLRDGILTGSGGLIRPNDTITRAEAATMVVRALGLLPAGSGSGAGVLTFADAALVPAWAAGYVAEAVAHGLINGLPGNVFDGSGTLSRAQAATVLCKAINIE